MRQLPLVALALLLGASPLHAEDQWGLSIGLTPAWQTGAPVRRLFSADAIEMRGSEVRFGVVRGDLFEGDWGFAFVDKSIDENSTLRVDDAACAAACSTLYRTHAQTRLTGVEFHQFRPFKTWRDRVQLGMVGALGVGWLRGTADKRITTPQGDVESLVVAADELFPPSASIVPLMKLEVAATGIVAPGLKIRVGGGFSMPGYHTFGITASYLVPND